MNDEIPHETSPVVDLNADAASEVPLAAIVAAPCRPRIWTVFVVLVLAVVLTLLVQILMLAAVFLFQVAAGAQVRDVARDLSDTMSDPWMFILLGLGAQLPFGLAAVVPAWLSPVPVRQRLGLVAARQGWLVYPLTMLGSLAPVAVGFACSDALAELIPPTDLVTVLFERMTPAAALPFVLFIALAPGFCEEMLFRGYVQRRLLQRWSPWTAIFVTSVLFALVHVDLHHVLFAFPIGVWLGVVAWRADSIGPTIACHAFLNGSVNLYRVVVKFTDVSESAQSYFERTAVVAGVAFFLWSLWLLGRKGHDQPC